MTAAPLLDADDLLSVEGDAIDSLGCTCRQQGDNGGQGGDQHGEAEATAHFGSPFVGRTSETDGRDRWLAGQGESDAQLVRRYQSGDVEAFTCLYQRHNAAVRDVCRRRLRDSALAEDAVQETFARALTALPGFTDGQLFEHWLKRVAANHCKDVLRRHERRNVPLDAEVGTPVDLKSEDEILRCIQRDAVTGVLREMSQRDAAVLVAHHVNGDPVTVLAQRWGQTSGAMKVTLHRARARFREVSAGMLGLAPFGPLRRWWRQTLWNLRQLDGGATAAASAMPAAAMQIVVAVSLTVSSPAFAATIDDGQRPARTSVMAMSGDTIAPLQALRAERASADVNRRLSAAAPRSRVGSSRNASRPQHAKPPVEVAPVHVPVVEKRVAQSSTAPPEYEYGVKVESGGRGARLGVQPHAGSDAERVHRTACTVAHVSPAGTYCTR